MREILLVLFSYLIGSFPSAYIAGHFLMGVDIRRVGDRNAGAANVYRNIRHWGGIAVAAIDIGKGMLAILMAKTITSEPIVLLCGAAAVAGHNWPVFIRFRGGKRSRYDARCADCLDTTANDHPFSSKCIALSGNT